MEKDKDVAAAIEQEPIENMIERQMRIDRRVEMDLPIEPIRREIRNDGQTEVVCVDAPGRGGACHEYLISQSEGWMSFFMVGFQNGPITEPDDVNGCQTEDLIAICIDRLEHFQKGEYACAENQKALRHMQFAMLELEQRTSDRKERGVEGTYNIIRESGGNEKSI